MEIHSNSPKLYYGFKDYILYVNEAHDYWYSSFLPQQMVNEEICSIPWWWQSHFQGCQQLLQLLVILWNITHLLIVLLVQI